jgi:hypothetical protein
MTMSTIMCPHCGGQLMIDPAQRLQSVLTCAYCGRKSLMQNIEEQILLRGIITQVSEPPIKTPEPEILPEEDSFEPSEIFPEVSSDVSPSDISPSDVSSFDSDNQLSEEESASEPSPDPTKKETLIMLATRAATARQSAEFNSYSRQAIDCDPTDPRMYVLRSRLIEEANGFARATFLSPNWLIQTPRYKSWIIAQHFSMLNTAIHFSPSSTHAELANEIGSLIATQIRENFVEHARLRLGKRPFKGRFRRKDLHQAKQTVDACLCINESVVPQIANELQLSIRTEIMRLDPKLSNHLQRIGL